MGNDITIARIAGIRIGLSWSWFVVFALITWSLADGIFPDQNPGLSNGTYIAMALVAAVLFFASLLAHELGHAFQARREGIEIDEITLWLFGGVAKLRGDLRSAGAEFRIAIAGPLVSLVIGGICLLVATQVAIAAEIDGVLFWLGSINLTLLVFNLLPALPLDGGRVLRAALWRARGDFRWATDVAAGVGRGFGVLFVAAGLFLFIFEGSFSGAWFAFIGWFLWQAATFESRQAHVRSALGGLRVRDLMTRDPVSVVPDLTLDRLVDEVLWNRRHTTYPVVEGEAPVGLLPFRAVAAVPRAEWPARRVRDAMLPLEQVPVLAPDDDIASVLPRLSEHGINRALVVDGGRLVGLLSATDVARALEVRHRTRR
jgi:Zn-dependent protease/CBS domain-containing protein